MTDQAIASAPGKLMLLGEHAVVYGSPCLVASINKRITVFIKRLTVNKLHLSLPDLKFDKKFNLRDLYIHSSPHQAVFVISAVSHFFHYFRKQSGLSIKTKSDFLPQLGLGSSSAVTVATLKALSRIFAKTISHENLFNLAFQSVKAVQKKISGFDLAAAVYGGIIYYQLNKSVLNLPKKNIPLLIVYSGIKADTEKMVNMVYQSKKINPLKVNRLFAAISQLVDKAKIAYKEDNWPLLGDLFNQNQKILTELGVSTAKLNLLAKTAVSSGAYGAKLSGAGGGDCLIVLYKVERRAQIIDAIKKNGGSLLDVFPETQGVKLL
ncbi:mevalonate kinase [Candidatus Gottesmanbacteria bacterium RBG_16_37_8]|uniref:Mevalonate kinase n=1 Tax=Candidatus Gottesmanbacteria bacterium RBG_16_37_8 TaxID=1798371 RepID=A0A1F5YUR1_9BACT|nr:MAG: mevalonate kinase [Candidatus Gottesmanbacteria bacterium RBG_16_37_8]